MPLSADPEGEGGTEGAGKLSDYYQVDPDQVYVGVGSDDVLSMSFLTFFTSGKRVLFPDITYSFYDVWADLYRIPYTAVPLRDDFTIDPENYIPGSDRFAAEGETLGGIIFPNPNAPTGVELPLSLVEKILAANPDIPVIVDEAYVDFGAESALSLLPKYENLLIVQTFSKSRAMAGLRIGFAIGNKKMIRYLTDVKFSFNSYTMNLPSIVMAEAAAKDAEYFHSLTARIIKTREQFKKDLTALGSPQEYLLQCRLRHACKLLSETNNPIQEIARNVGYDNPLTFSKIFKSYYGISPRAFREQQKTESQGEVRKNAEELPVLLCHCHGAAH